MGDVEDIVMCKETDLKENEMRVFEDDDKGKVLMVKQKGKIHALGAECTHYGAALEYGVLGNGRIRCQYHGACFNLATGDIEDFPGLDSLPCFPVTIKHGMVHVRISNRLLQEKKRRKSFTPRDLDVFQTIIIIGAGAAGVTCAETLRQEGFNGMVIMLTDEPVLPYDRVKLTKVLNPEIEKIALRDEEFFEQRTIEVLKRAQVLELDAKLRTVRLQTGELYTYDQVFIASGATPRTLSVKGSDLRKIFPLRTYCHSRLIYSNINGESNVVIVGSSFIAMELASTIAKQVNSVCVVSRGRLPLMDVFGELVASRIFTWFKEQGIRFQLNSQVMEFLGDEVLQEVVLSDGTHLEADVCIVGIGVIPNTEFIKSKEIQITDSRLITVDHFLQTTHPGIFAGGDVVVAPHANGQANITHWSNACYHGHIAARNMLGQKKRLNTVPYYWTVFFGKPFRYAGYALKFDDVVVTGDLENLKFVAYYCLEQTVLAVATSGMDPVASLFAERLHERKVLTKNEIETWIE